MTSGPGGSLTVYRASTHLGRARSFHIDVDGTERGTLRGSQRLEIKLDAGQRTVSARSGGHASTDLTVQVTADQQSFVLIDIEPTPNSRDASENAIVLRETDGLGTRASSGGGTRQAVGNPRSSRERVIYYAAFLLLLVGLVLAKTVSQTVALAPEIIGLVTVAVLFFRRFGDRGR